MKSRVRIFVSGKVQGVFFRSNTRDRARELSLTGWVMNLDDGRVEAVFEGEKEDVEKILKWAGKGPEYSKVENLEIIFEKYTGEFGGFKIKY